MMVRILSSGEIVADDDPRAQSASSSRNRDTASNTATPQPRQGHIQHADENAVAHMPQYSVFESLNQRLLDAGIPRWHAGPYVVEPIVSVGFLLAFLLLGFRGLLFAGLLFFICKWSGVGGGQAGEGQGQQPRGAPGGGGRGRWDGGGGGYRLGRS